MVMELELLALAIARQEGWFDSTSPHTPICQHCNNPGNLRWSPKRLKQVGRFGLPNNQYVIFADRFWGAAGLLNDLRAKLLAGCTLTSAINIYCPVGDGANDPKVYVRNVADWLKVNPDQKLSELFEDPGMVIEPIDFPEPRTKPPFTIS